VSSGHHSLTEGVRLPVLIALLKLIETIQVFFYLPAVAWVFLAFLFRVGVDEVRLGVGPRKVGFRLGDTTIGLGLLPLGCVVKFAYSGPRSFHRVPGWKRALLYVAGPLLCLLPAYLLLGAAAWPVFTSAVPDFFTLAYPPGLAAGAWRQMLSQDAVACAGAAAAATAALNLLPLPPLPGGLALVEGWSPSRAGTAPPWKTWLLNLSVALLFVLVLGWTLGLFQAVVSVA
jgi:membrane-associated protease RseP (regulator of RpoE activity)